MMRWPLLRRALKAGKIDGSGLPTKRVSRGCEHDWQYLEREPGETYTGYCERCSKCGEIVQIPQ